MPLDADMRTVIEQFAASGQPPFHELDPPSARMVASLVAAFDGEPEQVDRVEELHIPGPEGEVSARVYGRDLEPEGPLPVVMWFHAGGGVVGDLETADRTCRRLANRVQALIVSVDYRLAPEHPFPAGVEDCWTATTWMAENARSIGGDGTRLAVAGDSMGATFAALVAQRAAQLGGPHLLHQLLVYPLTDMSLGHDSVNEYGDGYIITKDTLKWFLKHLLVGTPDPTDPAVSPLHAKDLPRCAPATVLTAEFDPVRDEGEAYGRLLEDAGVPVSLKRFDGVTHVFFALSGVVGKAEEAMRFCADALNGAFRAHAPSR